MLSTPEHKGPPPLSEYSEYWTEAALHRLGLELLELIDTLENPELRPEVRENARLYLRWLIDKALV